MKRRRPAKRYAEGTKVAVHVSRGELEQLLRRHGAATILTVSDHGKERGFVQFAMAKRMFKLHVDYAVRQGRAKDVDQREREAWRLLALGVKAKLEFIRMGESTAEVEFLANVMLPDGTTVEEHVLPELERMYITGAMPKLLGAG